MPEFDPEKNPVARRFGAREQPYSFTVPSDTRRLYISAGGGSGGFASNAGIIDSIPSGAPGRGGRMSGVVRVNAGEVLTINVGKGANGNQPGAGFISGGKGGDRGEGGGGSNGGGGGAASGVWRGVDALIIAGCGGGAGGAGNATVAQGGGGGNGGHGGRAPTSNGAPGGYGAMGTHTADFAKGGRGGVFKSARTGAPVAARTATPVAVAAAVAVITAGKVVGLSEPEWLESHRWRRRWRVELCPAREQQCQYLPDRLQFAAKFRRICRDQ
jgi:hypothetical protein